MSVNYNIPTINAQLLDVVANIDAGSSFGMLRLLPTTSTDTVCLIPLAKPSGTVSGGILTFIGMPQTAPTLFTTTPTNPLALADIEDSGGTVVVSGLTVGVSTAYDILIPSVLILSGQSITLQSATITGV
jgi:hypothetical protein